ncbi:hypothetical protein B1A99_05880 [Cohnella sp. CIP 111063]|uniref:CPBP family intramembrane glutamic endopeptidase n=1 Tax=unclassified Cohnella TaxID=2636738 RepID=UPI000B8C43CD|nr:MULTISPECIES: type II CAAX endopeptidase family protein [unclassified Cohnella]OXS61054.1 hypothetical protein B1A99_05880 [Cohnella sp. CIP 111063]PRX73599.1 hypothetical protein B0G52_103196 [Cohnella sp. SGD-V74]
MKVVRAIGFIVLYLAIYVAVQLVSQSVLSQLSLQVSFIVNNVCTLAIYALLMKARKRSLLIFCRVKPISTKALLIAPLIGIALGTVIYSAANLPVIREDWPQIYNLVEFVGGGGNAIALTLLSTVLIGSLFEEVLFRGLILNEVRAVSPVYVAVLVQAVLFGVIMMDPILGGFAALGALLYGLVYWASDSLWASLIVHVFSSGTVMVWFQMGVSP